jgi:transcriptional regulator with PAS, ATPase and Fis domain
MRPLATDAEHPKNARQEDPERTPSRQSRFGGLIGESAAMRRLYEMIRKVSGTKCPVLISGETGTGKELVARSIHFAGPWKHGPFVPVDCTAISPGLFESELFGHVQGAFTGARYGKLGMMEAANGGALFLDEIGDLEIGLQAKLLRAIQEKEVRPVGSVYCHPLQIRIIAATNRVLETEIQEGLFRQDLFFRLNVVQLEIPPVRDRKSDIPLLVKDFIERYTEHNERPRTVSAECMAVLMAYDWPGNVRELGNAIEHAMALCRGTTIEPDDLPENFQSDARGHAPSGRPMLNLLELKRQAIHRALRETNGNRPAAARLLGIGNTQIYRRLKAYRESI